MGAAAAVQWVHPFERAGFGRAPYRVTGYDLRKFQACQGAPVQCGTSCDICMNGIMHVYLVTSSDGVTFKVGCDCVLKTRDTALSAGMRVARREFVNRDYWAKVKAERAAREAKKEEKRRAAAIEYAFGLDLLFALVFNAKSDYESRLFMRLGRALSDGDVPELYGEDESDQRESGAFWTAVHILSVGASKHFGTVGQRVRKLRVTFIREAIFEGFYGATFVSTLMTDEGNVLVWKSSTCLLGVRKPGTRFDLTATIKAHIEYNGVKQTVLSRCKVEK